MRIDEGDENLLHRSERSEVRRIVGPGHDSRVLKVVPRDAASTARVDALHREFELTSSLAGKNLVACLGLECRDDVWSLHFEDIGGSSLDACVGRDALDRDDFFAIAIGLSEALSSLHARSVLHLAIEPAHVVYAPATRELRVIDFSSAIGVKHAFADARYARRTSVFAAPELRALTPAPVDARTDLYGLGATLHALVHGVAPDFDEPVVTRSTHASDYVSPALLELVESLVRPNADERPTDADAVRRALVALRDGTELPLRAPPRGDDVARAFACVRAMPHGTLIFDGDSDASERAWIVGLEHARSSARVRFVFGDRDHDGRERVARALEESTESFVVVLDGPATSGGPSMHLADRLARTEGLSIPLIARRRAPDDLAFLESLPRRSVSYVTGGDRPITLGSLDELSDEAREVAFLTSLSREPTFLSVLARARAVPVATLGRAVTELVSAGIARPSATPLDPRLAIVSEGTRRALVATLTPDRRADLHLRLARAIDASAAALDASLAQSRVLHLAEGGEKIATETERRRRLDALVEGLEAAHATGDLGTCLSLGATLASACRPDDTSRIGRTLASALFTAAGVALDVASLDLAQTLLESARAVAMGREDIGRVHGVAMRLALARGHVESAFVELDSAIRAFTGTGILRGELSSTLAAHRAASLALSRTVPGVPAEGLAGRALDVLSRALDAEQSLPRRIGRAVAARAILLATESGTHSALALALSLLARELSRARPAVARRLSGLAVEHASREPARVARRVALTHAYAFDSSSFAERTASLRGVARDAARDGDESTALDALLAASLVDFEAGRPLDALARSLASTSASLPRSPRLALLAQVVDNLRTRDRLAPSELRGPRFEEGELVEAMRLRDHALVTLAFASRAVLASLFDEKDDAVRFRAAHSLSRSHDDPYAAALGVSFHAALAALDVDRSFAELLPMLLDVLLDAREAGDVASPRVTVLAAELLARTPLVDHAGRWFARAIDDAEARGRTLDAARIAERRARYHGRRGEKAPFERALARARDAYRTLGYDAKVDELELAYPWLGVASDA